MPSEFDKYAGTTLGPSSFGNSGGGYGGNILGSAAGGVLGNLFGGNPASAAYSELGKIPGKIAPYYEPYIEAGQRAIPTLEEQYGRLINDPTQLLSQLGENFQASPGYEYAKNQAIRAVNNRASAGGMAGSPAASQAVAESVTGLANQDYYNFLNHAIGLYGKGLEGTQGLYKGGLESSDALASAIGSVMAQQAGQKGEESSWWGNIGSALGSIGGFYLGGPAGAAAGSQIGGSLGGGGGGGGAGMFGFG